MILSELVKYPINSIHVIGLGSCQASRIIDGFRTSGAKFDPMKNVQNTSYEQNLFPLF